MTTWARVNNSGLIHRDRPFVRGFKTWGGSFVEVSLARATGELGWTFTFLSADLDGFAQGESFTAGLQGASAQYFRRESTDSTTRTLSADLLRMRRVQRDELRSRRGGRHGEDSSS